MALLQILKNNAVTILIVIAVVSVGAATYEHFFSDKTELIAKLEEQATAEAAAAEKAAAKKAAEAAKKAEAEKVEAAEEAKAKGCKEVKALEFFPAIGIKISPSASDTSATQAAVKYVRDEPAPQGK